MNWVEIVHSAGAEKALILFAKALRKYFRVDWHGIEKVPMKGPALIFANHSGFAGSDAIILAHLMSLERGRRPRILAHKAFFEWLGPVKALVESFGLRQCQVDSAAHDLESGALTLIFPEGEAGNFKPSSERYHLQRFHTGFLRMAIQSRAPIIPVLVIGAEESHINLGNLDLGKFVKSLRIPFPLPTIPLPAKWNIYVLDPIHLEQYSIEQARDRELMRRLSARIRHQMQKALREKVKARDYIYFSPDPSDTYGGVPPKE